MSVLYSPVARNPLVPELQPDVSHLTTAQKASYAAVGRALHTAGIQPQRLDFGSWQSCPPASFATNNPTEDDLAAVGLSLDLGANYYAFCVDGIALVDLVPDGTPSLSDNYVDDGLNHYVILAHGLDLAHDLLSGEVGDDPITAAFGFEEGLILVPPTTGVSMVGTGSYDRFLTRYSDAQPWTLSETTTTAADVRAAMEAEGDDPLLSTFAFIDPPGQAAKLQALHDRIAVVRLRRSELAADAWDELVIGPPHAALIIDPTWITVVVELPRNPMGAPHGIRIDSPPVWLYTAGKAPELRLSGGGHGRRIMLDRIPGTPGVWSRGGGFAPLKLTDRGVAKDQTWLVGWPVVFE